MRKIVYALISVSLTFGCVPSKQSMISADIVFEYVNIIPMDQNLVLTNKALAVKGGKIIAIVDQSKSNKIIATQRVDGKSRYLMPSLSDMHVHTRWDPKAMFNLYLAHGVTTVANMWLGDGNGKFDHLKLREKITTGEIVGPRYLVSSDHLQGDFPRTSGEAERLLDDYKASRIDFVKIHGDLPVKIYDTIVAGAKKRGLKVIGHAQHNKALSKTLELDGLEHIEELLYVARDQSMANKKDFLSYRDNVKRLRDQEYRRLVVEDIARSGIFVDPTLIVYKMVGVWSSDQELALIAESSEMQYLPEPVKEYWLKVESNPYQKDSFPLDKEEVERNLEVMFLLVKELNDAGVPLLLGTDTFGTLVPGASAHQELALLVEAGLSPYEALRCGTINAAKYLNESDTSGRIRVGFRADFILLDRNPPSGYREF